ncbi:ion channel [Hoeflea sp.]
MAVILAIGSISSIFYYAILYYDAIKVSFSGTGLDEKSPMIDAIYYSIVTWTTLGYGDITPMAHMKLVAASQALVGYGYSGMLIGVATALLLQQNER